MVEEINYKTRKARQVGPFGERTGFGWGIHFYADVGKCAENPPAANRAVVYGFKIQADVQMYSKLPDYDEFRRFYLSKEMALSSTAKSAVSGFSKP